jgi:hypothetical protein
VTPEFKELPRNHCARVAGLPAHERPLTLCPPELDPKWRFFWRIGPRPTETQFAQLNAEAVVPPEFPEWTQVSEGRAEELAGVILPY